MAWGYGRGTWTGENSVPEGLGRGGGPGTDLFPGVKAEGRTYDTGVESLPGSE